MDVLKRQRIVENHFRDEIEAFCSFINVLNSYSKSKTKLKVNTNNVHKRRFISTCQRVGGADIEAVIKTLLRNGIFKEFSNSSEMLPTNVNTGK